MTKNLMLVELLVDIALPSNFGSVGATINQKPLAPLKPESVMDTDGAPRLLYRVPRSLGLGTEERKRNSSMPSLWLGHTVFNQVTSVIQPRALVLGGWAPLWRGYRVRRWKRGRMVCGLGRSPVADPER